jgi:hypothetical protein
MITDCSIRAFVVRPAVIPFIRRNGSDANPGLSRCGGICPHRGPSHSCGAARPMIPSMETIPVIGPDRWAGC